MTITIITTITTIWLWWQPTTRDHHPQYCCNISTSLDGTINTRSHLVNSPPVALIYTCGTMGLIHQHRSSLLSLPTCSTNLSLFPSATTSQLVLTNQVNSTHHLNNCIHFQSLPLSFPSSPSIIYCKYYLTIFLVADPLGGSTMILHD